MGNYKVQEVLNTDVQFHINIDDSHNIKYALITGDPMRVESIARQLDEPEFVSHNREYHIWKGKIKGEGVFVASHGIGGPSTAIAIEELCAIGVKYFIRIGTCGGMALDVMGGDLIIANAAIRMDGTTNEYIPMEFPAVSDFEVTSALQEAANMLNVKSHIGIVQCKSSFYGQHNPLSMPVSGELTAKWEAWIRGGCLGSEMESATMFIVSQIRKAKSGCVLNVLWNQERENQGLSNPKSYDMNMAIKTAILATEIIISKYNK